MKGEQEREMVSVNLGASRLSLRTHSGSQLIDPSELERETTRIKEWP